jgi:tetratricopeptide (TPR) repeat protein
LACSTADKAIGIGPDLTFPRWLKLQCLLAQDSLQQARKSLREALKAVEFVQFSRWAAGVGAIASFAVIPNFLLVGDSMLQPKVEQLTVADYIDSVGFYGLKADMYRIQGRATLERAYLDSARVILESRVKAHPDEANFHAQLGLVYAHLGEKTEAVREGQTATKLLPIDREAYRGANLQAVLAMIYATVGMPSQAIDLLEHLLSIPSEINTGLLRHDPRWAVLRGNPRFEKMIAAR